MTPEQIAAIERLRELKNSDEHWDDDRVQAAFDEALPLIEALQQSLSEAQADARVFSGSYNALAEDFGRLKEENERLRDLLKDACTDLGRMTLLRDKFYCEMETAQTETVFAKKEIERLRDDLFQTVAAFAESGAKNADSVREMIGAVNSIEKSLKEAQAERDALQAELSSLKTDMFVLNNDMGYTTGILDDVLKQRDALRAELEDVDNERINVIADAEAVLRESAKKQDALQARVDGALVALGETNKPALGQSFWRALDNMVAAQNKAIEILAGEGE